MDISVRADIKAAKRELSRQQKKQIPFAASVAINDTAFGLRQELSDSTKKYMDRPTPFTQKGFRVNKSNKRNLHGSVQVQPNRWKYLRRIVDGSSGQSRPVPAQAKVNKYGNLPRTYSRTRRGKPKFFSGVPKGGGQAGLWERTNKNKRLKLHVAYEKNVSHGKHWPFTRIADTYIKRNFKGNMDKALAKALATAR